MSDRSLDPVYDALHAVFEHSGFRRSMGFRIQRGEGVESVVECAITPEYANTVGVAHGGLVSGLVDSAAGIAAKLAAGDATIRVATVALTINYHRPGRVGRTIRAVGRQISGKATPCCTVEVHDDEGEHIATGMATLRVRTKD